jgi:hypothetical protein
MMSNELFKFTLRFHRAGKNVSMQVREWCGSEEKYRWRGLKDGHAHHVVFKTDDEGVPMVPMSLENMPPSQRKEPQSDEHKAKYRVGLKKLEQHLKMDQRDVTSCGKVLDELLNDKELPYNGGDWPAMLLRRANMPMEAAESSDSDSEESEDDAPFVPSKETCPIGTTVIMAGGEYTFLMGDVIGFDETLGVNQGQFKIHWRDVSEQYRKERWRRILTKNRAFVLQQEAAPGDQNSAPQKVHNGYRDMTDTYDLAQIQMVVRLTQGHRLTASSREALVALCQVLGKKEEEEEEEEVETEDEQEEEEEDEEDEEDEEMEVEEDAEKEQMNDQAKAPGRDFTNKMSEGPLKALFEAALAAQVAAHGPVTTSIYNRIYDECRSRPALHSRRRKGI